MSGREGRSTELAKRLESHKYNKRYNHYGVYKLPVSTNKDLTIRGANGSSGG